MNESGEDGVGVVVTVTVKEQQTEQRYCGDCYSTLLPSEKSCHNGCTGEIKTMPAVVQEEAIIPSKALATEHPDPFYGSFGCPLNRGNQPPLRT